MEQCSTFGVEGAPHPIVPAASHGVTFVDAPVLGSRVPAEQGKLIVLASGPEDALERCAPFFAAVAERVVALGPAGKGSRMKMVTNTWIMATVASVAETMALAEALDVDGALFLEAIAGTPMDMGYAQSKGGMIVAREYPVQMSLENGAARVITAAAALMQEAADAGHGGVDMAAAFHGAVAQAKTETGGRA